MSSFITLNNFLALLTFCSLLGSIIGNTKGWKIVTGILGFLFLVCTLFKNGQDSTKDIVIKQESDSLKTKLKEIHSYNRQLLDKIDSTNIYIKKIEMLGITRDSLRNAPIVNKSFVNYIKNIRTLNQY